MGLTKRKDSYYVEFRVIDDGKMLQLATGITGTRLKRWKVGSLNKTTAKQQEALIKTELMKGIVQTKQTKQMTFKEWGMKYLELEEVKRLRSFQDRKEIMENQLIPFLARRCWQILHPPMWRRIDTNVLKRMARLLSCRR